MTVSKAKVICTHVLSDSQGIKMNSLLGPVHFHKKINEDAKNKTKVKN